MENLNNLKIQLKIFYLLTLFIKVKFRVSKSIYKFAYINIKYQKITIRIY
jgi:hypothetical protein